MPLSTVQAPASADLRRRSTGPARGRLRRRRARGGDQLLHRLGSRRLRSRFERFTRVRLHRDRLRRVVGHSVVVGRRQDRSLFRWLDCGDWGGAPWASARPARRRSVVEIGRGVAVLREPVRDRSSRQARGRWCSARARWCSARTRCRNWRVTVRRRAPRPGRRIERLGARRLGCPAGTEAGVAAGRAAWVAARPKVRLPRAGRSCRRSCRRPRTRRLRTGRRNRVRAGAVGAAEAARASTEPLPPGRPAGPASGPVGVAESSETSG